MWITGIMSIFQNDARVLIDSGSDKSYISSAFARLADRALSPLEYPLVVQTPLGKEILKSVEFKECPIKMGEVELEANLIPLELQDFDAILGMDWLKKYRAAINCFEKKVLLQGPDGSEVKFLGERRILPTCLITALAAEKLLRKGCQAFLA